MIRANTRGRSRRALATCILTLVLVACSQAEAKLPAVPTITQPPTRPATTPEPTSTSPAPTATAALPTATPGVPLDDRGFADRTFRRLWDRSDGDVADGSVARSWLWGPPVPSGSRYEPYAEASEAERLVEYFDKGRMEINDPSASPTDPWYVTSGLLTVELVTGRLQIGDEAFEELEPAEIPVAGDLERVDPLTPYYADFAGERLEPVPARIGQTVTTQLRRGQDDVRITPPATVKVAAYDEVSGHNIPDVFIDYFDQTLSDMDLNALFVMGHPITEPYWIDVRFAGKSQLVLVQLFERRALTYNPANDEEWRVEFANIGLHYYRWRYHDR